MSLKLKEKIEEAVSSVLPIVIIVLIISTILVPISIGTLAMFLAGSILLVIGMGFFTLGVDMAMMPMGEAIGTQLVKMKWLLPVIALVFLIGFVITLAEPDLDILARQISSIPNRVLIYTVSAGVGVLLVIALLRIMFRIKLSLLLIVFYTGVLILSFFAPDNFLAVAFDSGGVTTGPITVPFILAFGLGLASQRSDKQSQDDSFGLVALCSIGPIIAVLILSILYNPENATYDKVVIPNVNTLQDIVKHFAIELPIFAKDVLFALVPIGVFFIIFQIASRKFSKSRLTKIAIGLLYTYIGLVLFLTGVDVGFIPVGSLLGSELASSSFKWLLIPLGVIIGYYIVAAEPAVYVLNKQVEEVSGGSIPAKAMKLSLSIGVGISVALGMLRVLTGISIYWLIIPGYAFALILSFFVPKIFTGIAFDSGGVASGPMTTTFLLPFAMGACEAVGGNILMDAFGIVAMVAMTPLIAVQLMGLVYQQKTKKAIDEEDEEVKEYLILTDFKEGSE